MNRVREKETKIKLTCNISTKKKNVTHAIMYWSNQSFNIVPPGNPPYAFDFFDNCCSNYPLPSQNALQMPHTRVLPGDQMPPPREHFTGA